MRFWKRTAYAGFQRVGADPIVKHKGLRVSFDVTKDDSPDPNHGTIRIYNLNPNQVHDIVGGGDWRVYLWAGYDTDDPPLLFVGDITKATTSREGADTITEIESGDGQDALSSTKMSKSFSTDIDAGSMLGEMAGSLAENLGMDGKSAEQRVSSSVNSLVPETPNPYPRGATFDGPASHSLSQALRANKLDFTIQDGELIIVRPGFSDQTEAFRISETSGLVSDPGLTDDGRLEITSLLNSELRPLKAVVIDTTQFEGVYVIRKVEYKGDTHATDFYANLELTEDLS